MAFVLNRRNKLIQVWNNLRVSKWWQNVNFCMNYPFKFWHNVFFFHWLIPSNPIKQTAKVCFFVIVCVVVTFWRFLRISLSTYVGSLGWTSFSWLDIFVCFLNWLLTSCKSLFSLVKISKKRAVECFIFHPIYCGGFVFLPPAVQVLNFPRRTDDI